MLMADSLEVLSSGPVAATTKIVGDVDGGPPGVLSVGPAAATTEVVADVDGKPLAGGAGVSGSGHHRSCSKRRWRVP
jgi:hypothetical protein